MARLLKRKRVAILSGQNAFDPEAYVDIPVIAEIDLLGSRGQEFRYRFINDKTSQGRTVRVKKVGSATGEFGTAAVSTDQYANVERILQMPFTSPLELTEVAAKPQLGNLAWQTDKKFKNNDPAPKQPDGRNDPHHLQVHYVRYYKKNDTSEAYWVDSELIDKIEMLGTNAQEFNFRLRWPTAEDYAGMGSDPKLGQVVTDDDPYNPIVGWCDPDLALLDIEFDEDSGKPLPTRTDPFQNICNIGSGNAVVFFKDLT